MPLQIDFPDSLPVSAKRDEIAAAIQAHQVVIVCGETGSGKTTQLPKIALALGRGKLNAPEGRGRLIGHTQPRRIAASSVAKRIAEELKTPLGEVVGYKVRFQDRLSRDASVKLMTDGILLAETQTDPLLKAYDTLIIDEAHERSLNIDFLLGYLREILPRRPDLKVIVTSATIDAERFAKHFESRNGPAPVIYVSGRTFPVEMRWRPFEESREYDLNDAIADGVDELWQGNAAGDILVFLPGEREIREAADHLRKHLSHQPVMRAAEVLPLFSRLSQAEQDRIFEGHTGRRIVLATNVAETSLTVPGIRYVIDAGTARVKRYSFRSKVEQLLVEPVSQAAANQRAGRCGRVANGICIRLYDEKDFASRPRFTDPEILRSSLAGVILRMKSLHLGDVTAFPFLEAPSGRAVADGYQLLGELGAVDDANELTDIGRELARLPLDPRVGRMILEGRTRGALQEVLVIASAMSVQDVRDRPLEAQQQADQAHAKFDDEKSEFSGYLTLWKWLHEARGGAPVAQTRREMAAATQAPKRASAAVLPVSQRLAVAEGGEPPPQPSPSGGGSEDPSRAGEGGEDREAMLVRLRALQAELTTLQGESPLILPTVDYQAVAAVVGDWTGIPVGRMQRNEIDTVLKLPLLLGQRVIGQDHAMEMIAKRIQTSRAGLDNPSKPIGVFMLAGTSGVGKTETALALAEALYGGEQNLIVINMSEYQEAHTVSSLKGAPPGYVGYGEGGVLTEAVRRKPYSVVLLDEVEKAHSDVHELFFQVFDKGFMEDGEGRTIDFKNTLILLTTNAGTDLIASMCRDPELMPDPESMAKALREPLLKVFPPALLGRLVTIPYYPLSDEMLGSIVRLQLGRIKKRVEARYKIPFEVGDDVVKLVVSRCTESESGGRMIDAILTNTMLPDISREFLTRMMEGKPIERVRVGVDNGNFTYQF